MSAAADVAAALGNNRLEGHDWRCECPLCHKITLTLRDGKKRLLVKCWGGCVSKDILEELSRRSLGGTKQSNGTTAPEARTEYEARTATEAAKRQARIDAALDIWRNSFPATDTIVETYLWSRLLMQPISPALRYVPALWHKEAGMNRPAMIGLVEHVELGAVAIHATYLNPLDPTVRVTIDPRKRSIGPVKGGAVRLAPAGKTLAIAEGIEDALTYMKATGGTAWAAISASGIRNLVPPPLEITSKIIFIEDDDRTGQEAIADAARRLTREGYAIEIARPISGKDVNAALLAIGPGPAETLFTIENYGPTSDNWYAACLAGSDGRTLSNLSNTLLALGADAAWQASFTCNGMSDAALLTQPPPPRINRKD